MVFLKLVGDDWIRFAMEHVFFLNLKDFGNLKFGFYPALSWQNVVQTPYLPHKP